MKNGIFESHLLTKLNDHDLVELTKLYKDVKWAPQVICLIDFVLNLKKSRKDKYGEAYQFYSIGDCWKVDGTIIVTILESDLFFFTLDEKFENLAIGLRSCKFLTNFLMLFCVHEKFISLAKQILNEKQWEIKKETPCNMFAVAPQTAANLRVDCPANVYIRQLGQESATKINNAWPQQYPGSIKRIETIIEMNGGFGLFLKETDELAAWVLVDRFGHMGILQTDEKHRKKGYAELVLRHLARKIGSEKHSPFATVISTNVPAVKLFKKLGFGVIGNAAYYVCQPMHS